ncbi:hypothetical protein ACHQM5_005709 [Ranunculus cassubicifolius]
MDGTRIQKIEANVIEHNGRFDEISSQQREMGGEVKSLHHSMEEMQAQISTLATGITNLMAGQERLYTIMGKEIPSSPEVRSSVLGPPPNIDQSGKSIQTPVDLSQNGSSSNLLSKNLGLFKYPKLDFPCFAGDNVRNWIQKANRFFLFNPIEETQKVLFASLYLKEKAEVWYQSCSTTLEGLSWLRFCEAIQSRFSDEANDNIVGEFKQLVQTTTVEEYQQKFEVLQPLMLIANPGLTEAYFVDSFVSGLKEEIRHTVLMFKPKTLIHAITLAKLQETTLECSPKYNRTSHSFSPSPSSYTRTPPTPRSYSLLMSAHLCIFPALFIYISCIFIPINNAYG